ncbi:hypothetical protein IPM65_01185 [Candidatus Roizmanbacteria bacterium]|nr:MAG: hypothetical protein IPM65_01185 [Candidatus Roizmanbacteria bacterium]
MSNQIQTPVSLDLEIISRISLQGKPEVLINEIQNYVTLYLEDMYPDVTVTDVSITKRENTSRYDIVLTVTALPNQNISKRDIDNLKLLLNVKYDGVFSMRIDQIEKKVYVF